MKGGKVRKFKSVNPMSRVDTECGESFCSFPELFQDSLTYLNNEFLESDFIKGWGTFWKVQKRSTNTIVT